MKTLWAETNTFDKVFLSGCFLLLILNPFFLVPFFRQSVEFGGFVFISVVQYSGIQVVYIMLFYVLYPMKSVQSVETRSKYFPIFRQFLMQLPVGAIMLSMLLALHYVIYTDLNGIELPLIASYWMYLIVPLVLAFHIFIAKYMSKNKVTDFMFSGYMFLVDIAFLGMYIYVIYQSTIILE